MEVKIKSELTKVSMNLSTKSLANIDELSKLMHENNKTRVVASSLEIARYIIQQADEGSKILIKDSEDNTQELKILV